MSSLSLGSFSIQISRCCSRKFVFFLDLWPIFFCTEHYISEQTFSSKRKSIRMEIILKKKGDFYFIRRYTPCVYVVSFFISLGSFFLHFSKWEIGNRLLTIIDCVHTRNRRRCRRPSSTNRPDLVRLLFILPLCAT